MNKLDELLKIKELFDLGIITEADFKRKKTELLNDSNTGNVNSDFKKDIIIGENEKECPNCKYIIEKESETCNFCDYDFINNKTEDKNINTIEKNNNLKKYVPVFFVIIIFIFLGTWFFTENNSEIIQDETPKVATPDSTKSASSISTDSTSYNTLSKMATAPAAEASQNSENSSAIQINEQTNNYDSDSYGVSNTSKSKIEESNKNSNDSQDTINHIVTKGETMNSIAKKYKVNSNELYKLYNVQPNTYEFYKANSNPEKPIKPNTLIIIPSNLIRSK